MLEKEFSKAWNYYYKNYKKLVIIPLILIIVMTSVLAYTKITTGEFFAKDVSVKGGYTATVTTSQELNVQDLSSKLSFLDNPEIRVIKDALQTQILGYEIISEKNLTSTQIIDFFADEYGITLDSQQVSIGFQSAAIASTFFEQATKALLLAFLLMGAVVFYYFRKPASSLSIILSTLLDVICILGTMNWLGIKVSTASIGALLMIVGYSADSDILLSTNIIKRKDKPLKERMLRAFKTEMTINLAAFAVFATMFLLSNVVMIKEIAIILLFGVFYDFINTWLGTAALQRVLVVERK
jgi:preprotein translocase subunit SecF